MIFEYRCKTCGYITEKFERRPRRDDDPNIIKCAKCGKDAEYKISTSQVHMDSWRQDVIKYYKDNKDVGAPVENR